jgi:RND family efflux transporter MFP subunit
MRRYRALLTGLLIALAGSGCEPHTPDKARLRVTTLTVTQRTFSSPVTLTGDIQPRLLAQQSFRVSGKIVQRLVDTGDQVSAGQVLARLDPQEQQNLLGSAQAEVDARNAELKLARLNFGRQQKLIPKGYTTLSQYDDANARLHAARSQLAAAQAQLAASRDQLAYTQLQASAAGVITARYAEAGEVVQATTPIFDLALDGGRDAVFNVYESLLAHVAQGQQVTVRLSSQPAIAAAGQVREITPAVDPGSGTLKVKVSLQDPAEAMRLGSVVSIQFTPRAEDRIVLPWAALFKKATGPAVWIVEDDVVALRPVSQLTYDSEEIVVGSGLAAGERVVLAGGQLLHPGQRVESVTPAKVQP